MKTAILLAVLFVGASSLPVAPSLEAKEIQNRHVHPAGAWEFPTVDATSTRAQWVSSYGNKPPKKAQENEPTVDGTSTRGQWVSSHGNNPPKKFQEGPTVDATSTRAQCVSSYGNKPPKKGASFSDHWLPVGPGYLDLDALESGYHAHLMIMHDSTSWLQSGMTAIKRFMRRFA